MGNSSSRGMHSDDSSVFAALFLAVAVIFRTVSVSPNCCFRAIKAEAGPADDPEVERRWILLTP